MLRPTLSRGLYLQQVGRGLRPWNGDGSECKQLEEQEMQKQKQKQKQHAGDEGTREEGKEESKRAMARKKKTDCVILDLAGNTFRHGPVDGPIGLSFFALFACPDSDGVPAVRVSFIRESQLGLCASLLALLFISLSLSLSLFISVPVSISISINCHVHPGSFTQGTNGKQRLVSHLVFRIRVVPPRFSDSRPHAWGLE